MRIIAGKYGGRIIKTPTKKAIHPMGERIRNAIFNKLAADIEGKIVLDCCAGSGAVGIEALSRGAAKVYFVEKDRQAIDVIKHNLELLAISSSDYQIIPTTTLNWLQSAPIEPFDLVLADPPYHKLQNQMILALAQILKPAAKLVLSNPKQVPNLTIPGLDLIDSKIYAEAKINFYQKR